MEVFRPLKAIRLKCLDCSNGSSHEVRFCPVMSCPLYPYRYGKRPATVAKHSAQPLGFSDSDDEDDEVIAEEGEE